MDLSLIVPYRDRKLHFNTMLKWFKISSNLNNKIELVIVDSNKTPSANPHLNLGRITYIHAPMKGSFNKSKLLNIGLRNACGRYSVPFDIDLVPVDLSFECHLKLAKCYENGLVTGYRLLYPKKSILCDEIPAAILNAEIAKEDCSVKFLKMQLIERQRFGVLPFFLTERLHEINGWDEAFEGWGAEDQDIIERYLYQNGNLLRCPDLLYIHLHHKNSNGWNDANLTRKNLERYHDKRTQFNSCNLKS